MAQDVVTHFVAEHRDNLALATAIEKIVVHRYLRRSEETGNIRRHFLGLLGCIELIDVVDRYTLGARKRKDVLLEFAFTQRLVVIDKWRDIDRCDRDAEDHERCHDGSAPHPPVSSAGSDRGIHERPYNRESHKLHGEEDGKIAEPFQEVLVRQTVLMLAEELLVDRHRQGEYCGDHHINHDVDRDLPEP